MNHSKRQQIFAILQKQNPNPSTELRYHSTFQLLVAVILSAQATDISVNKATLALFTAHPDAKAIYKLGEKGLIQYIKSIGLYNSKAKHIIATCEILLTQYDNLVPDRREQLEKLPGVGRKTANVILNTAFGVAVIAVDTHIFRVSNRTKLALGKNVEAVEKKLDKVVPAKYKQNAHHWLILQGRYVCKARKPLCEQCIIYTLCEYHQKEKYGKKL